MRHGAGVHPLAVSRVSVAGKKQSESVLASNN